MQPVSGATASSIVPLSGLGTTATSAAAVVSSAAAATGSTTDMDLQTMQSMDWLFKKERIYLLAQFWQQRATLAEKEVTTLKEQLGSNPSHTENSIKAEVNMDRHSFESELASKDKEISQLLDEIQRLQVTISKVQESSVQQVQRLEQQLDQKRSHIQRLEMKLDTQRDYDDLKRELSILRNSEYSSNCNNEMKPSLDILLERSKSSHSDRPKSPLELDDGRPDSTPLPTSTTPTQLMVTTPTPSGGDNANNNSTTAPSSSSLTPTAKSTASTPQPPPLSDTPAPPAQQSSPTHSSGTSQSGGSSSHHHQLNGMKSPTGAAVNLLGGPHMIIGEDNNNIPFNVAMNSFLRNTEQPEHHLKSPFRFDTEHRPAFRFAEDLGMAPGSMVGRLGESLIPKGDPMEAKLQEMLRYNMDKYATQNLDTLHISRRVRELLSIHNIGQRLFAKYILGLSQGTVSELLSKPKPWDKLTEKGRDSYRKMHAWACDESAVMLLKSLIPKKDHLSSGKDPASMTPGGGPPPGSGAPPYGRPDPVAAAAAAAAAAVAAGNPDLTEERLAHLLSEASHLHMKQQGMLGQHMLDESLHSNDEDSKSPQPQHPMCTSPFAKDTSQNRRLKKYENDDIPQEKVLRIYNEELSKLMGKRIEDMRNPNAFQSMFFPQLFGTAPQPPLLDRTQDEIRLALDAYQREIIKINQVPGGQMPNISLLALQQQALAQHNGGGCVQDLSIPKDKIKGMMNGLMGGHGPMMQHQHQHMQQQQQQQLQQQQQQEDKNMDKENDGGSTDPRHSGSAFSLVRPKIEPGSTPTQTTSSTASSPLGNNILPPAMTPGCPDQDFPSSSPLQRMASITNSLISQPTSQPHHSSNQRPLKAVLPPITQQQFDLYNNLNTEDIVKKVKEQLSQYSISQRFRQDFNMAKLPLMQYPFSQRLFGESVLGLSQGSVSDLLARPKPWHMLTQKGREPFIRMKMFLEDDNAVHKLVASQYKIAPEKLMRTGGYGGNFTFPPIAPGAPGCPPGPMGVNPMSGKPSMQPTPKMLSDAAVGLFSKMQQDAVQANLLPPTLQQTINHNNNNNQQQQPMLLTPPGVPPHHAITLPSEIMKKQVQQQQQQQVVQQQQQQQHSGGASPHRNIPHSPISLQQQQNLRSLHQHISPSVYEMAALTQDLDTQVITTKIKEALLANNIGQKIFGEAVLGLSQGSVSELLSKPKPWHMLSIKGREPFIRMQLWLNDAHNVDRLQALKNERREANKRRRSSGAGGHDNSSDTSSNDTSEFYHSNSPGPGPHHHHPSAKKQRVLFSEEQKEALRLAFALDPYPNVATIEFLAQELDLSSRTITNWFHNHRMRLKQQVPHHGLPSTDLPPRDSSSSQPPFDPIQFRLLLNQRLLELNKERMLGGVPLPYPPYLATNPNLAALISRGLLPATELEMLGNAVKEQMGVVGLDLSMASGVSGKVDFDDEDDGESNVGSEDSNISDLRDDVSKLDVTRKEQLNQALRDLHHHHNNHNNNQAKSSSRRKPAAPQWVNPDWQDDKDKPMGVRAPQGNPSSTSDEVIINGVCVMQTEDYGRRSSEEMVLVEPTPVLDPARDEDPDVSDEEDEDNRLINHSEEDEQQPQVLEDQQQQQNCTDVDSEHAHVNESERKEVKSEKDEDLVERWVEQY